MAMGRRPSPPECRKVGTFCTFYTQGVWKPPKEGDSCFLKGQVQTGGTDGLISPVGDNGMEQVQSGEMAFTVIYPTNAPEAFAMAKDILLNCATSVQKTTNPATLLMDKNNVAQVSADLKAAAGS